MDDLSISRKYVLGKDYTTDQRIFKDQTKYTLRYNKTHPTEFLSDELKTDLSNVFTPSKGIDNPVAKRHILKYSRSAGRDAHMYLTLKPYVYAKRNLRSLYRKKPLVGDSLN
jgi:hypothetical protein